MEENLANKEKVNTQSSITLDNNHRKHFWYISFCYIYVTFKSLYVNI